MPSATTPELSIDDIDDLLYYTRINDETTLQETITRLSQQFSCSPIAIITSCVDPEDGNTILHFCSANGFTQLLTTLLKPLNENTTVANKQSSSTNSDSILLRLINSKNEQGNTPLHWAAYNGHLDAVKVLIAAGADMWIKNSAGHLALFQAEQAERNDVVQFLLEAGGTAVEQTGSAGMEDDEAEEIRMTAGDVSGEGAVVADSQMSS